MTGWLWRVVANWLLPPSWASAIGVTHAVDDYEPRAYIDDNGDVVSHPVTAESMGAPAALDAWYPPDTPMPTLQQIKDRYSY